MSKEYFRKKTAAGFAPPFQKRAGFTLLETVVALTVILAAIVGPVSLITRGLFDFSFSKDQVIAVNLAQEGVELVRLIRENNIACNNLGGSVSWNSDPRGGLMTALRVGVDATVQDTVSCNGASLPFPHMSSDCTSPLRYESNGSLSTSGTYGYIQSDATIFSRCVDITSGAQVQNPTPGIPAADQMDVISTVSWNEHSTPRTVTVRERLYNWK